MTMLRDWTTGNLVGLGVLGLAVVWMVASGCRAARLDPLPENSAEGSGRVAYPVSASAPLPPTPAILAAVRANPMRPDRRRSDGRYGQEPIAEDAEPEPPEPVPAFRVVGIVQRRTGPDLAAIAADGTSAQLVRQGGRIQGFVLNRVRRDSVFLARPDTAIGLAAPGRRYGGGSD
jgi:hypothetical protein